jgi:hypothetical protein
MVGTGVLPFSVLFLGRNKPNRRTPLSTPAHGKAPATTPKPKPPPHILAKTLIFFSQYLDVDWFLFLISPR